VKISPLDVLSSSKQNHSVRPRSGRSYR